MSGRTRGCLRYPSRVPSISEWPSATRVHVRRKGRGRRRHVGQAPNNVRSIPRSCHSEAAAGTVDVVTEVRREAALLKTGALRNAILNSANFSIITTDEKGVIQLFNVGAERMLGYTAIEVVDKITRTAECEETEIWASISRVPTSRR